MSHESKASAQRRVDQINAFRNELNILQDERILSLQPEQLAAVDDYHARLIAQLGERFDVDHDERSRQLSWGMRIASFLGALALSASVFFLFFQFWGHFSTTLQVVILIASPLLTFILTVYIAQHDKTGYFAKLVALVSFVCLVLNLVMLGQIFNITPSDKALIIWAAYALLLAYMLDMRLLLAAGIICIIGFISARAGTWSGMYWLSFGDRPENFLPAALVIFFMPQLIRHQRYWGFAPVYRVFGLLTLLLPVLVLSNWGSASYLQWDDDIIEGMYQLAGFVFSGVAIWYGMRRSWADVVNTGNVFFVIFLYTKMFDWWWEIMPKYLFFLVIGLISVLLLFVFKRLRDSGILSVREVSR